MKNLSKESTNYFPALTGIRAIAAYMVFIHHFNPIPEVVFGKLTYGFFQEMHIGVTVFFVLSGFLITHRYYDSKTFSFKKYMVNRFARIYPMYFILTSITFAWNYFRYDRNTFSDLLVYFFNISFLRGFFDYIIFSGVAQGWSLTVEEMFYFMMPFFFFMLRKNKFYILIMPLFFISIGLLLVRISTHIDFYGIMNSNHFMFTYTFFGRCFEFFVGIALALFVKKNKSTFSFKKFTYLGIAVIILCLLALSVLRGDLDSGVKSTEGKWVNNFILPLFGISVLFYGLLKEKTLISKFLESNIMQVLGKSSYIFYLIHIGIFFNFFTKFIPSLFIIFVILNIISILLYKLLENPINNQIRKLNTYFKN